MVLCCLSEKNWLPRFLRQTSQDFIDLATRCQLVKVTGNSGQVFRVDITALKISVNKC